MAEEFPYGPVRYLSELLKLSLSASGSSRLRLSISRAPSVGVGPENAIVVKIEKQKQKAESRGRGWWTLIDRRRVRHAQTARCGGAEEGSLAYEGKRRQRRNSGSTTLPISLHSSLRTRAFVPFKYSTLDCDLGFQQTLTNARAFATILQVRLWLNNFSTFSDSLEAHLA